MVHATRLLCPLPHCTWGEAEYGEQDGEGDAELLVEAGGRYMTPAHYSTIAQTQEDIKVHMEAHKLAAATATPEPATTATAAPKSKPAKLDRPKCEMDMSESDWTMFLAEWARYCRSC